MPARIFFLGFLTHCHSANIHYFVPLGESDDLERLSFSDEAEFYVTRNVEITTIGSCPKVLGFWGRLERVGKFGDSGKFNIHSFLGIIRLLHYILLV